MVVAFRVVENLTQRNITLDSVGDVHLDHYRSCSWREKRQVLDAFWRTDSNPTERFVKATVEYGHYAIICLEVVLAEIAIIAAVAIRRGSSLAWWSLGAEVLVMFATWWAVVRYRALHILATHSMSDPLMTTNVS